MDVLHYGTLYDTAHEHAVHSLDLANELAAPPSTHLNILMHRHTLPNSTRVYGKGRSSAGLAVSYN
jgi:hypothetical protein